MLVVPGTLVPWYNKTQRRPTTMVLYYSCSDESETPLCTRGCTKRGCCTNTDIDILAPPVAEPQPGQSAESERLVRVGSLYTSESQNYPTILYLFTFQDEKVNERLLE
jgi:hypothetical protein